MTTRPTRMIRYTVRPDQVERNEALVRAVYAELERTRPEGLRYATFKLEDGVTFMHVAWSENEQSPLLGLAAFEAFQDGIRERCSEPPAVTELEEIGSFRWAAG